MQLLPAGTPLRPAGEHAYAPAVAADPAALKPKFLKNTKTGVLQLYNDVLAQEKDWVPCNTLPDYHIRGIQNAAIRDSAEEDARTRYQLEAEAREAKVQEQQKAEQENQKQRMLAMPTTVPTDPKHIQEQYATDLFVIAQSDIVGLSRFCQERNYPIHLDPSKGILRLRADVRNMLDQRTGIVRTDLETPNQGLAPTQAVENRARAIAGEHGLTLVTDASVVRDVPIAPQGLAPVAASAPVAAAPSPPAAVAEAPVAAPAEQTNWPTAPAVAWSVPEAPTQAPWK